MPIRNAARSLTLAALTLFVFTAPFAAPLAAQAGGDMKPDAKPLPSPAATAETLLGSGRVTIT